MGILLISLRVHMIILMKHGKYCAGAAIGAASGDCQAESFSAGGATSAASTPCPAAVSGEKGWTLF